MQILLYLWTLMAQLNCPKCGGYSWIEIESDSVIQHCVCGLHKYLYWKTPDGATITRVPVQRDNFSLPIRGSQLSKVLGCLVLLGNLTSKQIALQLNITVDKATTNLSVLRQRGLITPVEDRKGQAGGSLWTVFEIVKTKFGSK